MCWDRSSVLALNLITSKAKRGKGSVIYSLSAERTQHICFSGEVKVSVFDCKKCLGYKIPEGLCMAGWTVACQSSSLEANGK